jgi:hypothetical protein
LRSNRSGPEHRGEEQEKESGRRETRKGFHKYLELINTFSPLSAQTGQFGRHSGQSVLRLTTTRSAEANNASAMAFRATDFVAPVV